MNHNLLTPYFSPISFDKFFETGQFEEKTNSVHCGLEEVLLVNLKKAKENHE